MKKRIFCIILIVVCFCATGIIIWKGFTPDTMSKLTFKGNSTLGVWWWREENALQYIDFACENGVDEIYYCDSKFDKDTADFVSLCTSRGIKVFLLCGEKEWIEDASGLNNLILRYNEFQIQNPNNQFHGIHLDIEPHQFSDFSENRAGYLQKYVNTIAEITTQNSNINFDVDLPFWLNDLVTYNNVEKPVYQHIIDLANRVFVLSYRDTAEKVVDVAKEELEYAKSLNKPIFVSVEMRSKEGDAISFQEEGKNALYNELYKLEDLINQSYGISIHHIESWFELKE